MQSIGDPLPKKLEFMLNLSLCRFGANCVIQVRSQRCWHWLTDKILENISHIPKSPINNCIASTTLATAIELQFCHIGEFSRLILSCILDPFSPGTLVNKFFFIRTITVQTVDWTCTSWSWNFPARSDDVGLLHLKFKEFYVASFATCKCEALLPGSLTSLTCSVAHTIADAPRRQWSAFLSHQS